MPPEEHSNSSTEKKNFSIARSLLYWLLDFLLGTMNREKTTLSQTMPKQIKATYVYQTLYHDATTTTTAVSKGKKEMSSLRLIKFHAMMIYGKEGYSSTHTHTHIQELITVEENAQYHVPTALLPVKESLG
jgi:hypothetical protein